MTAGDKRLSGMKVAILVANGFEQSELTEPRQALLDQGAQVFIVSPEGATVRGWRHGDWADTIAVDVPLDHADADAYDALLLPGGVINPDRLRRHPRAAELVRSFVVKGKPVAAICHGPQLLIDANVVRARTLTSYETLRRDLENAGAIWVNEPVAVDLGIVTSRKPEDIPAFNRSLIEEFAKAKRLEQPLQTKRVAARDMSARKTT